jgi:hypothetical protein
MKPDNKTAALQNLAADCKLPTQHLVSLSFGQTAYLGCPDSSHWAQLHCLKSCDPHVLGGEYDSISMLE